jgi:hypothetical protein
MSLSVQNLHLTLWFVGPNAAVCISILSLMFQKGSNANGGFDLAAHFPNLILFRNAYNPKIMGPFKRNKKIKD